MFHFQPASLSETETVESYLSSLSSPIDSYLEDHILASTFHRILAMVNVVNVGHACSVTSDSALSTAASGASAPLLEPAEVGFFTLHAGSLLTQFHLVGPARRYGQQIFADVLRQSGATAAYVPTCDEFFLSHALDVCGDVKKQAYFFVEGGASVQAPAVQPPVTYRPALSSDLPEILALSGDFLDAPAESVAGDKIHVGFIDDQLVAIGIVEKGRLLKGHASIGMFTSESHRNRGIGVGTLLHLRRLCHTAGLIPIAGCWYYNYASKKTLEAAGMVSSTRLLRFEFLPQR